MKFANAIALFSCAGVLAAGIGIVACGGSSNTGPSGGSTPSALPTPTPTPTATPTPAEIACTPPTPAPVNGFRVKIQIDQGYKKVLDSRALVGPSTSYCSAIGYGGDTCVARNENDPQAVTCQNLVVGIATDTKRYGPTWYWVPPGTSTPQLCRPAGDPGQDAGCKNHPDNQYFIIAYGPGVFSPCATDGVCGGFEIK